ncbi:COMM domain-containing protein 8-like isoform X2 [Tachypleus tridentatus]|uniref:COMM domain-containing protein 8-like isoform X2 n=1 Tax=Tachypleus tridentatus TaxID=6853 RepID=UPI003FD1CFB2
MSEELGLLVKIPLSRVTSFLNSVVDQICGIKYTSYENYSDVFTVSEWWNIIHESEMFLRDAVGKSLDKEQVSKLLSQLPEEYQDLVQHCINAHFATISKQLRTETHAITSSHLSDFDWKLKLAVSSDKLAVLRQPLLELDLKIKQGETPICLSVELCKDELKELITSLEGAQKSVVQLKS